MGEGEVMQPQCNVVHEEKRPMYEPGKTINNLFIIYRIQHVRESHVDIFILKSTGFKCHYVKHYLTD